MLSEVSQTNTVCYHLYVESKKYNKLVNVTKKNRLTDTENRLVVAKGESTGGGMYRKFGISRYKLLYVCKTESVCCTPEINTTS